MPHVNEPLCIVICARTADASCAQATLENSIHVRETRRISLWQRSNELHPFITLSLPLRQVLISFTDSYRKLHSHGVSVIELGFEQGS